MNEVMKKLAMAILSFILILTLIPTVNAQQTNSDKEVIVQPSKLGTVSMGAGITADVKGLMLIPTGSGQMASFMLSIHNESSKDINLVDYWANIITKSGTKYNVTLASEDVDKVHAKSNVDLQFYSNVGKDVKLSDLKVQIFKWDFSNINYQKSLGTISVPQRYNPVTPARVQQEVPTIDGSLGFYIEHALIGKSEDFYRPDIKLQVTNSGKKNVTLPEYQLSVLTSEGLIYQLSATGLNNTTLGPLMDKEFQLTGSIPIKVKEDKWRLVLSVPVTDKKIMVPLAMFDLPKSNVQDVNDVGKYYSFVNADGVYYIKLNSINRIPFEDQDIISANLTIMNKGTEALTVPTITGQFKFDDSIKRDASVLLPDKIISIPPGQSIDIAEMCKIPYTYDLSKLKLTIQQKDSETKDVTDLVSFSYNEDFSPIPSIALDSSYQIQDVGYRSEIAIRKTQTYEGTSAKIFAAQVMVTNEEKRLTNIKQLAGYFENINGEVYPATVQKFDEKITTGGKALLHAWALMPTDVDTSNLKLVLGKAILTSTSNSENSVTEQVAGYVNPVSFVLSKEQPAQNTMIDIDNYPFTLSLTKIGTKLDYQGGNVYLNFDYNLKKDILVKSNLSNDNIIIEISDDENNISFAKSISLDNDKSESEVKFKLGDNSAELTWGVGSLKIYDISLLNKFSLNVYQEIQPGQKKLLATQKFDWLVRN